MNTAETQAQCRPTHNIEQEGRSLASGGSEHAECTGHVHAQTVQQTKKATHKRHTQQTNSARAGALATNLSKATQQTTRQTILQPLQLACASKPFSLLPHTPCPCPCHKATLVPTRRLPTNKKTSCVADSLDHRTPAPRHARNVQIICTTLLPCPSVHHCMH